MRNFTKYRGRGSLCKSVALRDDIFFRYASHPFLQSTNKGGRIFAERENSTNQTKIQYITMQWKKIQNWILHFPIFPLIFNFHNYCTWIICRWLIAFTAPRSYISLHVQRSAKWRNKELSQRYNRKPYRNYVEREVERNYLLLLIFSKNNFKLMRKFKKKVSA